MRLPDEELKNLVLQEVDDAMGFVGSEVSEQRSTAMEYYLGEPFGNEIDDRSQVVVTEVADTIESIMPVLMKTFSSTDEAVRFEPVGPEDDAAAEQETDYVNHVFYKKNQGFLVLYEMFKDALIQKNGVVKVWWSDEEKKRTEEYKGLNDLELAQLDSEEGYEIKEHDERVESGPQGPMLVHDVMVEITDKTGCPKVDVVPPEEFLVSKRQTSLNLQEADFVAHRTRKTVGELRAEGYSEDKLEMVGGDTIPLTEEETARYHIEDETRGMSAKHPSLKEVWVTEAYYRIDRNDDGVNELIKVTVADKTLLDIEEVDLIPFAAITPIILSHKYYGLSVADLVEDLQLIKSTVLRQLLDNMYQMNNQRTAVDEAVNLDDLLTTRPGGVVRVQGQGGVGDHLTPIQTAPMPNDAFGMLGYLDELKTSRVGVNQQMQGQNYDLHNQTAQAVERVMTAAEARIELIARVFAETGVKDLFKLLHKLLQQYQDKQEVVKLRGQWVPVNPTEWKDRDDMTISVGLGTGQKEKTFGQMMAFLQQQKEFLQMGFGNILVTPKNIYNTLDQAAKAVNINMFDMMFTDPESPEVQQFMMAQSQQEQPDPNMMAMQIQQQIEQQGNETKILLEQMKGEREAQKLQMDALQKDLDRQSKESIEAMKEEVKAMIEGMKIDLGASGISAGVQDGS